MQDISAPSASRIAPLPAGDREPSDDSRARRRVSPKPSGHESPAPPVDAEKDDEHQLDERA
jgi:hypothetical protein